MKIGKPFFFLFMLWTFRAQADEMSRERYRQIITEHPHLIEPKGCFTKGEIEILTDTESLQEIERELGRDVGIVKEDKYWVWINDACRFPSGAVGIYGRILWKKGVLSSDPQGVAIAPLTLDGKIVLNCNFRHASRSWEIELPRGLINTGETPEEAAIREAGEETGRRVGKITKLGEIAVDTGVLGTIVPVFCANVTEIEPSQQEETEAIETVLELSISEIKKAFADGFYECMLRNELKQVPFRDPFLAYALLKLEK